MFSLLNLIGLIPVLVAGVQTIHSDQPGTTKKQKVLQYLGLGEAALGTVLPSSQVFIEAINKGIDATVAELHAANAPGFGTNSAPAPAPAA